MAAVTICSDFGAQEHKVCHCFHSFHICLPWNDERGCRDLHFLHPPHKSVLLPGLYKDWTMAPACWRPRIAILSWSQINLSLLVKYPTSTSFRPTIDLGWWKTSMNLILCNKDTWYTSQANMAHLASLNRYGKKYLRTCGISYAEKS